jgi:hypothetical protein
MRRETCTPSPGLLRNPTSPRKRGEVENSAVLFRELGLNRHQDAFGISENVVIPESKHAIAVFSQATIAYYIRRGLIVLTAIDFNDQSSFSADKVADVTEYWHLPDELVPIDLPVADAIPEDCFRVRLIDA